MSPRRTERAGGSDRRRRARRRGGWGACGAVGASIAFAAGAAHGQGAASDAESLRDLQRRVLRGEVSPFKVWEDAALPDAIRAAWGMEEDAGGRDDGAGAWQGRTAAMSGALRGGVVVYFDDFSSYTRSGDPIFDRFEVGIGGQLSPPPLGGVAWSNTQPWFIPTLFVDPPATDPLTGLPDPLPRWQGATLREVEPGGLLPGDISGDCVVDTADLGALLAAFGGSGKGAGGADVNGDGVVDTADLGLLLGQFGQECARVCLYQATVVRGTTPEGGALDGSTIGAGPAAGQVIAVANGVWGNDSDPADGCGDCEFFRVDPVGGAEGERVYGTWTLLDADAGSADGADVVAVVENDTCAGWGTNAALADARGEDQSLLQEGVCCFFGARSRFAHFCAREDSPVTLDVDVYKESLSTLTWVDLQHSLCCGVTRAFIGGFAAALDPGFVPYDTTGDGYTDSFIFLGNVPGNLQFGEFFGTIPDGQGGVGKRILPGEWFTVRFKVFTNEIQVWLRDSETMALSDGAPGDDGGGTPADGSDDLEGGFAKIFPIGPYGRCVSGDSGLLAQVPQPLGAANCVDTVRILWGGDPAASQDSGFVITNSYYDNLRVEGELLDLFAFEQPKFALQYLDDMETYTERAPLSLQGGRWFDANSSRAVITSELAASGTRSIKQENWFNDGAYRDEFRTRLPLAVAQDTNVIAACRVALSGAGVVRGIRLEDNTFALGIDHTLVARLLTGVEDENGQVVVDGMGRSRWHVRTRNPNFDPGMEPLPAGLDLDRLTPTPPGNLDYINVPTDRLLGAPDTFFDVEFEIAPDRTLEIRIDGVPVLPDPTLAPLMGYAAAGWIAESIGVDEMGFESGNQVFAPLEALYVDDVRLMGLEPVVVDGPAFALPYEDDFEDYPAPAPIHGQGWTPFFSTASIPDGFLCIEQGARALNLTTNDDDTWCVYEIRPDGVETPNDYGLDPGDLIYVRQADCEGVVACKSLEKFTNPNRPTEPIPNVALVDAAGMKATEGAQVLNDTPGTFTGTPPGAMNCFEWDTHDAGSVFCRYTVNSIDAIGSAGYAANEDYYNGVVGKVQVGDVIAVDSLFDIDPISGESDCPGIVGWASFKVVDPCGVTMVEGTWTRADDGAGALGCGDEAHFAFTAEVSPRWNGGAGGGILVVEDPTGSGRGRVLQTVNNSGFSRDDSMFIALRSTLPTADADAGSAMVVEYDIWVRDFNSRLTVMHAGPEGDITEIMFGGPDNIPGDNPGGMPYAATNTFRLLERNPVFGSSGGPREFFVDSGEAVPLQTWVRMALTVQPGGAYTYTFDGAPITTPPGPHSGKAIDAGADAIDGFDTNQAFDEGGDGAFLREPIEIVQSLMQPAGVFPDDFCFYSIDTIDGGGGPSGNPAPCEDEATELELGFLVGVRRDAGLPNWPNGGAADICPESNEYVWRPAGSGGLGVNCTGDWHFVDPADPRVNIDYPAAPGHVTVWATYSFIAPYAQPDPASRWHIDNVRIRVVP